MTKFIRLTNGEYPIIYVNPALITAMQRDGNWTVIRTAGQAQWIWVKEKPEEILAKIGKKGA